IDMGSTIIGGSAFLSIESAEGSSLTTISLMPTFGYFVSPGFMMGGTVSLLSMSSGGASVTAFGIGPELRYYFNANNIDPEIKGSMYPYLGAFVSFVGESGSDDNLTQFGGVLGFNQMMSEQLSSEFQFRVFRTSYGNDFNTTTIYFGIGITGFLY
ncbi:MAG: hypothetical protein GY865_15065, partial [candidate division Zixibacteria bacterium]|nr:hypothetical protein [candidate division Zixibacteria bacterium]